MIHIPIDLDQPMRHTAQSAILNPSTSLRVVKDIRQPTLPTVLTVMHSSHEDPRTTSRRRTLPAQPLNLPIPIDLVVLEHSQFDLLPLVLDLFGRRVHLLLALLGAAAEAQDQVERGFLLNVVV